MAEQDNQNQQLATTPKRPVVPVQDTSQFANFLDSAKFDQLYRVARVFAASAIIPDHFRGKEADCFIACQMALRLGVDPFMFMQNTYVVSGRPGMEAKLAIALINSSGLFVGPLQYTLDGKDDDFGCTCSATLRETGERVQGPRVTIAIAKSEGWYARNPKWKNVPQLMLQYRAASWFGRLCCPERLMGMQTADELDDLPQDSRAVPATLVAEDKPARIARKLAKQTTEEAPTTGAKAEDVPPPAGAEQSAAGSANSEASAPASPAVILPRTWDEFVEFSSQYAQEHAIEPSVAAKAIQSKCRLLGKFGKEKTITGDTLSEWAARMLDGSWAW